MLLSKSYLCNQIFENQTNPHIYLYKTDSHSPILEWIAKNVSRKHLLFTLHKTYTVHHLFYNSAPNCIDIWTAHLTHSAYKNRRSATKTQENPNFHISISNTSPYPSSRSAQCTSTMQFNAQWRVWAISDRMHVHHPLIANLRNVHRARAGEANSAMQLSSNAW